MIVLAILGVAQAASVELSLQSGDQRSDWTVDVQTEQVRTRAPGIEGWEVGLELTDPDAVSMNVQVYELVPGRLGERPVQVTDSSLTVAAGQTAALRFEPADTLRRRRQARGGQPVESLRLELTPQPEH